MTYEQAYKQVIRSIEKKKETASVTGPWGTLNRVHKEMISLQKKVEKDE